MTNRDVLRRILAAPFRRAFWGELVWVLLGVPLSVLCLALLVVGLALGIGLSPLFLGLLLIAATLLGARSIGRMHRALASGLLGVRVAAPPRRELRPGLWNWVKARVGDQAGWRVTAYLVVRTPLALAELAITAVLLVYGFGTLTYPVTWFILDGQGEAVFDIYTRVWILTIPLALLGLLILLATPWILHGMLVLDRLLVRGLLSASTLSERVRDLEESRATAVEDATVKLRRIERDLHDGAQARLVAVAMKLGVAKDEPDGDQLRTLVASAHENAKLALVELRDLARGIHPPALDAGLEVALSTLAATSAADVRLSVDLPTRPPPSIETIVYFSAAELLTNAAKHGDGRVIDVEVDLVPGGLRLAVSDSGDGGARITPGGGLAGLADRVRTVDGRLGISSPPGGPTVITVEIPLAQETPCES